MIIKQSNTLYTRLFVWGVVAAMAAIACNFMAIYSTRFPLAEDWYLVAPLTGKESNFLQWMWSQVNEHRIPFPRLIYLILLQVTGGDFRVGGYFNIALLTALSLGMIEVTYHLRGRRTDFADAFFPLIWLHLGHSANLLMGWQITQVFPTAIIGMLLLLFVSQKTFISTPVALIAGISLILMPLCGGNGLICVPFLGIWLSYCAILNWRANAKTNKLRWVSLFLFGSTIVSFLISLLYFVNYQKAYWNPPSPNLSTSIATGIKLLALGWGPFVSRGWIVFVLITLVFVAIVTGLLIRSAIQLQDLKRHQAIGLLGFFANLILFSLLVGHARAGSVPKWGLPVRYVIFAVPTLCAVFLIAELYGRYRLKTSLQRGMFFMILLLLPLNTVAGFYDFTNWYRDETVALARDISLRLPPSQLAARWREKHGDFVLRPFTDSELLARIKMLYDAGIEPFAQIREENNSNQQIKREKPKS